MTDQRLSVSKISNFQFCENSIYKKTATPQKWYYTVASPQVILPTSNQTGEAMNTLSSRSTISCAFSKSINHVANLNSKGREWGIIYLRGTNSISKIILSLLYNRMFSLFVFLTLYLFWNPKWWKQEKWCEQNGRGLESYLEITTIHQRQLKLNWKTTMLRV